MRALIYLFAVVVGGFFLLALFNPPKDRLPVAANTSLTTATSQFHEVDAYIAKMKRLQSIEVKNMRWRMEAAGTVMVASFTLRNTNDFSVKDIAVTCEAYGASGTLIDKSTRTVYDIIKVKGAKTVRDLNMGFVHQQAARASCAVSGFDRS